MLEIILVILLIFVIFILSVIIYFYEKRYRTLEKWIMMLGLRINEVLTNIDEIDKQGIFKSDDEVGFLFKSLKDILESLGEFRAAERETTLEEKTKEEK